MTPLQAARQYDVREGFDVVDFAEVGLPVFRLTVEAVTLARLEMPTLHEFVLRSILIGEADTRGIARLLGLSENVVEDALATLAYDRCVALVQLPVAVDASEDTPDEIVHALKRYEVTEFGLEKMREGERTPRDEPLVFDYDGIRRHPVALGSESVRRPKELSEEGVIQIRPYPADTPDVSELPLMGVARVVRRRSGKEFERGILALRRIARRESLFRPAVGLLYQSRTTDEVQIGFVIGDQLAQDYEIEFAKHGGAKKPGLIRSSVGDRASLRAFLGPERYAAIAHGDELNRLRLNVTLASRERAALGAKLERLRQRPKLKTVEDDDAAIVEQHLRAARRELDSVPLRGLAPYEQWELFDEALEDVERRLYISSADVDPSRAHVFFVRRLNEHLDNDVDVRIDTTVTLSAEPRGAPGSFEPGVELWLSARQKRRLTLGKRTEVHADLYFLIKDDDLAIATNRPFLCGRGRPLSFVPTVGVVTRCPEIVADIAKMAGVEELPARHNHGHRRG